MKQSFLTRTDMNEFILWDKTKNRRMPYLFVFEITARCNNNCRHCYINLPIDDRKATENEITFNEIERISDEAVALGSIWCLITGGEPLLREDFAEIYRCLKKRGLLVTVFTNATLITEQHIKLFKDFPPRNIEVTVYGIKKETYEGITGKPGSFSSFCRGLNLLRKGGINVRLKTMALRSNLNELNGIFNFCQKRTSDYFRFDPFLQRRLDHDVEKNEQIEHERLSADEIVSVETLDPNRIRALERKCDLIVQEASLLGSPYIFRCSAGRSIFSISYDGFFHICPSLPLKGMQYNLRTGTLADAWNNFVPGILAMRSERKQYLDNCAFCPLINMCFWCPSHAFLEVGEMDLPVDYFCKVAKARAKAIGLDTLVRDDNLMKK